MSRTRTIRTLGAGLAVALAAGCGSPVLIPAAPAAAPGQPAGTVIVPTGADVAAAVQRVQDAITAGGGTVSAVVDNTTDARAAGVEIPPNTVVIGGPAAAVVPLVRLDQRAAVNLPERYLVRQNADGTIGIMFNDADFVAAVSGVSVPDAVVPFATDSDAVAAQSAPVTEVPLGSPLVGVSPANYFRSVFSGFDQPGTVERLRRNTAAGPSKVVTVIDMAAGATDGGAPVRPTSLLLVSTPEAEAPLVAATPTFGLELPMRYVVWTDEQGLIQIGYPDVLRLGLRHGIPATDPNLVRLAADADRLIRLAAGIA